jgi:hypothetical protein
MYNQGKCVVKKKKICVAVDIKCTKLILYCIKNIIQFINEYKPLTQLYCSHLTEDIVGYNSSIATKYFSFTVLAWLAMAILKLHFP